MKKWLLFLFAGSLLWFNQQSANGQESDTVFVNSLLKRHHVYIKINKDSAFLYAHQALHLAEKTNYQQGILYSNLAVAELLIEQQQRDKARGYLLSALQAAMAMQQYSLAGNILNNLGNQSYRIADYLAAESYYQQALQIQKENKPEEVLVKIYTNLGMTYTKLTDYTRAFEALTLSNQLADSLDLRAHIGGNYIDIAILFGLQKKYDESLQYYQKALEIFKEEGDTILMEYAVSGIGETHMQMGNYTQAVDYFLSMEKSLVEYSSQFTLYQNLGICFRAMGELGNAEAYLVKAQRVNDQFIHNEFFSLRSSLERARLLQIKRQYPQAIELALQAEKYAIQQGVLSSYKECLDVLSSLYETIGDNSIALTYQKKLIVVQDSIARIDETKRLAEAETRFRLGEKNREVSLLEKENELQKVREQTDRLIMVMLVGSIVILLVAAGFTARAYRRSQAKNNLLASQKEEIEKASLLITEQSKQLLELDKMKSRFFANISHELRTPVTLLTGMLEFMAEGKGSQKETERVNIALGNSRKLNTIVEEMLDLTRLEANKVILKKKVVLAHPLLNRITGAFGSLLEKKQLRLVTDYIALQPTYLEVDEDKFEKIINNLIYNAIKFTPSGGWIRLQTRLTPDKRALEIQVSDSGDGITQEDLPHIFDRFYQSQSGSQKHDSQGTGIGLSLVKEFTLLHGGEVSVSSVPGDGAVFTLQFPLAEVSIATVIENDQESEVFTWKKFEKAPSVLLVEDHDEMRTYVRELLGDGFTVSEAPNGVEALQWLTSHTADLIISDVMMPQMDGYTFLTHLKNTEALRHIPVIMLTARAAEEDKLHGLSLGVDDYLVKPFNATELKIRVQNVLLNQSSRREWLLKPAQPDEQIVATAADEKFIEAVVSYVETNITQPLIAVGDLASHLALSERQLYRKTGELTGMAPAQLIKEIRLKVAYRLLADKQVSKVAELAIRVGFESPAYFSRQFMERFGKRPTEFL